MSNQSGITASQDSINQFNSAVSNGSRAIIFKIENEVISVDKILQGTSSFQKDWALLDTELTETDARYVFYHNDLANSANYYVFIAYVPDHANVRSKMLYASTKNTFLRQLGNEDLIKKQYLANSKQEVSYNGWLEFEKSEQLEAPLTENEKSLRQINETEVNTLLYNNVGHSSTTGKRSLLRMDSHQSESSVSSASSLSAAVNATLVDDDVLEKLRSEKFQYAHSLVTAKIDNSTETIKSKEFEIGVSALNVPSTIAKTEGPQFAFYRTNDSRTVFIYSCPSGSKIRERMLYASTKRGFLEKLKANDIKVDKLVEVGDPDEIEVSDLEKDQALAPAGHGQAPSSLRFNKPKGPRRR